MSLTKKTHARQKPGGRAEALPHLVAVALFTLLAGCSRAPSVDILGSFFPGWMVCLTVAVILTFMIRWVLVKVHVETQVGPLALFYPSLLTLLTCVIWLICFR